MGGHGAAESSGRQANRSFISDHIAKEYDQCLIFGDALGSRWSEPSTLRHWMNQQMLIPYASDCTSFLQEPDTHEHRRFKSQYKKVNGELQHDLEHELRVQGKESARTWGAWELMHILSEGQARFRAANPRVPLQGLVQNQVFAYRPDRKGKAMEAKPQVQDK